MVICFVQHHLGIALFLSSTTVHVHVTLLIEGYRSVLEKKKNLFREPFFVVEDMFLAFVFSSRIIY